METTKDHWEKIYASKKINEVSWMQEIPSTSLDFIHTINLSNDAAIIDEGGGESRLIDFLLDEGFSNLTVLDISEQALFKAHTRLGEMASKVKWIVSDVTEFRAVQKFNMWHDRATFHFLTTQEQIKKYVALAACCANENGFMAIGTSSENGPTKCGGLEIKQYSETELEKTLTYYFRKIKCLTEDHVTPFQTVQNFLLAA